MIDEYGGIFSELHFYHATRHLPFVFVSQLTLNICRILATLMLTPLKAAPMTPETGFGRVTFVSHTEYEPEPCEDKTHISTGRTNG